MISLKATLTKPCSGNVRKNLQSRAEAQRFEINKCSIFFVDSAPLRLCARYFCSFRNSFTASGRQGHVKVVEGKGEKNGRPVEEKQKPRPAACAAQPPAGQRMTGG